MGVSKTPFSQLTIPDKDAARDVPFWLSQLGSDLDTKLVLYATDSTERDAKYSSAPRGVLCVSTTDGSVWVKTSSATTLPPVWGSVYTPPTTVTWYNLSFQSGYSQGGYSGPPQAAQIGPFVYLRGSFAKSDGSSLNSGLGSGNSWGILPSQVKWPLLGYEPIPVCCGYQNDDPVGRLELSASGTVGFNVDTPTYWASVNGAFYYTG